MSKDTEIQKTLDTMLLTDAAVIHGKMFGYPAYYTNGKLFACIYQGAVGIKVPEKLAVSLIGQEGIDYFQPMGRPKMKEWIQLTREQPEDYEGDRDIFQAAKEYAATLVNK